MSMPHYLPASGRPLTSSSAPRASTTRVRRSANAVFVKVVHNGKVIHEHVELKGETRGGYPEKPMGPLRLQGDHGPVAFRNIRIRPLS